MRIHDQEVERYTGDFIYHRRNGSDSVDEITVKVKALPPDWRKDAYTLFPRPKVPVSKTDLKKDPITGQMKPVENPEDEVYLEELSRHEEFIMAYQIHTAVLPGQIIWETPEAIEGNNQSRIRFYEGVYGELRDAFGEGELRQWQIVIVSCGQWGGADLELAEGGFFRLGGRKEGLPGDEKE